MPDGKENFGVLNNANSKTGENNPVNKTSGEINQDISNIYILLKKCL